MRGFEEDLMRMIENIQFRNVNEPFQGKLREAVRSITKTDDIIVKADKTKHVYHMSEDQYSKLLQDNVTKNYKLALDATFAQISHRLTLKRRNLRKNWTWAIERKPWQRQEPSSR